MEATVVDLNGTSPNGTTGCIVIETRHSDGSISTNWFKDRVYIAYRDFYPDGSEPTFHTYWTGN